MVRVINPSTEDDDKPVYRFFPKVLDVHRLVEFLSLNDKVTEVKACPICLGCEFGTKFAWQTECLLCGSYVMYKNMMIYSKERYMEILTRRPLSNNGKLFVLPSELHIKNERCYKDLTAVEINQLDLVI